MVDFFVLLLRREYHLHTNCLSNRKKILTLHSKLQSYFVHTINTAVRVPVESVWSFLGWRNTSYFIGIFRWDLELFGKCSFGKKASSLSLVGGTTKNIIRGWSSSKLHIIVVPLCRWSVVGGWWIVTLTTTMLGFWWSGWTNSSLSDVLEGFFFGDMGWIGLDYCCREDSSKKTNASCYSINRNKIRIILISKLICRREI